MTFFIFLWDFQGSMRAAVGNHCSEIRQDGSCSLWADKTSSGWVLHGRDGGHSDTVSCSVNLLLEPQATSLTNSLWSTSIRLC